MCDVKDGWVCVGKRDQVQPDMPLTVQQGDRGIGIYDLEGTLYATEDVCPHAYALLSQGFVQNDTVECPLHAAIFNIRTGELMEGPGGRDLHTYPVALQGDSVYVQIKVQ